MVTHVDLGDVPEPCENHDCECGPGELRKALRNFWKQFPVGFAHNGNDAREDELTTNPD